MLCFSYLTHITLTKSYKHTHKHSHKQAHEVTLLKNTNTQNDTQKPKDTHTQNTDKHQDTQTLTNTDGQTQNCSSLHIRISCHCLFCPAISPISSQSLIEMKVLQQCLSASYSCPTSMPQLLYSCSQFFTALVQLQFFKLLSFFLSRSLNITFESSTTSNLYRQPSALNSINHIGLELCPH